MATLEPVRRGERLGRALSAVIHAEKLTECIALGAWGLQRRDLVR